MAKLDYYHNSLASNESVSRGHEFWNSYYNLIFRCNSALEGLQGNSKLTSRIKDQLTGEALFIRSWLNFYLVNLYGSIPLPTSTDPEQTRLLVRTSVDQVYQAIIKDLLSARELLNDKYLNGRLTNYGVGLEQRVRPTKWAATALLARVYIYSEKWQLAEMESTRIIDNTALFNLDPIGFTFLKGSKDAIWQIQPTSIGWNTTEGRRFNLSAIPSGLGFEKQVQLSSYLLNAFEPDDQREDLWISSFGEPPNLSYFPYKYKEGEYNPNLLNLDQMQEYSICLRLSEMYLIRAEARANEGNLNGSIDDINKVRLRANLPLIEKVISSVSAKELLNAILHERQVELFCEWGHRWFDLKRVNKINEIMSKVTPEKGGTWETEDQLLPIPFNDLLFNPRLTQNPGY